MTEVFSPTGSMALGGAPRQAPPNARRKRASMSCDRCRSRKTKCIDADPGPCKFCASIGAVCRTDLSRRKRRPYYQVSEAEFRYMTDILRQCFPGRELNLETLKCLSESLSAAKAPPSELSDIPTTGSTHASPEDISLSGDHNDNPTDEDTDVTSPPQDTTIEEIGQLHQQLASLTIDSSGNYSECFFLPFAEWLETNRLIGYVGADSGFGFNAAVRSLAPFQAPDSPANDIVGPLKAGTLPPPPNPLNPEANMSLELLLDHYLPPRQVADYYISRFCRDVHAIFWFFSSEQLYSRLRSTYENGARSQSASWMCSLYSIFAIVAQSEENAVPNALLKTCLEYLRMARLLVAQMTDEADVDSIVAFALLGLALQSACFGNTAYLYIGGAVRIAFSLGMHLDKAHASQCQLERERNRRIWCSLLILDLEASLRYGNPCAIPEEDILEDLQMPSEYILSPGPNMPPDYLSATYMLAKLRRKIRSELYQKPKTKGSRSITISSVHAGIESLKEWFNALPSHLKDVAHVAPMHSRSVSVLHLRFWHAMIFASRQFLLYTVLNADKLQNASAEKRAYFDSLASICIDAAEHSFSILNSMLGKRELSSLATFDTTCHLESTQVFLLALAKTGNQLYRERVRSCVHILQSMEQIGWTKHAYNELLTQLRDSYVWLEEQEDATSDSQQWAFGRKEGEEGMQGLAEAAGVFDMVLINTSGNVDLSPIPDLWDCLGFEDPS